MFAVGSMMIAFSETTGASTHTTFKVTEAMAADLQQSIDNVKRHPLPCLPAMQSGGVEGSGGISTQAYAVQHALRRVRERRGEKVRLTPLVESACGH